MEIETAYINVKNSLLDICLPVSCLSIIWLLYRPIGLNTIQCCRGGIEIISSCNEKKNLLEWIYPPEAGFYGKED